METKRRNINKVWAILLAALVLVVTVFPGALAQRVFAEEAGTVTVSGTIEWIGDKAAERPESVTVKLLADWQDCGKSVTVTPNGDTWSFSFTGLDKYKDGKNVDYSVEETAIEGYGIYISKEADNSFKITNHYETCTSSTIPFELTLDDSLAQRSGDIYKFEITADDGGPLPDPAVLELKSNGTDHVIKGSFSAITFKRPADGKNKTYAYTIKQKDVPDGVKLDETEYKVIADVIIEDVKAGEDYESIRAVLATDKDGVNVTVTQKPTEEGSDWIDVTVSKKWRDGDVKPDSLTADLKAGDTVVDSQDLNEENNWTYQWTVPAKDDEDQDIDYSVVVAGPKAEVYYENELTLTDIEITKEWDDADDQDGYRLTADEFKESVSLMKGTGASAEEVSGDYEAEVTDNEDGTYTVKFSGMPKYSKGKEITYSIREKAVDHYTAASNEAVNGGKITNKHTPETTKVTVEKNWDDAADHDGFRKDVNAKVQLYKTVAETKTAVGDLVDVGTADGWSKTWDKLPVYEDGKIIKYSVEEILPKESKYTKSGDDTILEAKKDDSGKITITNAYTPEKTKVNVEKVWDDADDQDNMRPSSISVKLYADGEYTGKTATVVAGNDNSWSYEFTGLDKYKAGKEIEYTIEETPVPRNYAAEITGTAAEGFTVKNTHTTETTKVKVTKIWDDEDDQDGKRASAGARVQLYKTVGEEKTAVDRSVNVGTEDNWSYEWENLPVYENKQQITYSIEEILPDGSKYEKSGDDVTLLAKKGDSGEITITNTYEPEVTKVSVEKIWDDADDQDGIRKDVNAKVQLFKTVDGTRTAVGDPVDVGIADNWNHSWENLPVYEGGKQITYSIEETLHDGSKYEKSGDDKTLAAKTDDSGKVTITNTHTPEKTTIKGTKVWADDNDRDGKRPESIKVKLLADGKETGKTAEVKADKDGNWAYEFAGLAKFKDGKEIEYTVEEEAVEWYETEITGNAEEGFVIKNTVKPPVNIKLTKKLPVYFDADGKDKAGAEKADVAANATTVFRIKVLDKDGKGLYENYFSFKFNEAGTQSEDIELPLLSGAATLTVEEVYSAGYASTGYNTTVDLTAEDFDSSKTIEVGFENTFDENRNRPGGIINTYTDNDGDGKKEHSSR